MEEYEFSIANDGVQIEPLQEELQRTLQATDVRLKTIYSLNVALGECLENIIQHAYQDSDRHAIEVHCAVSDSEIELRVSDDGRPFDLTQFPMLDTTVPGSDRVFTGQGIHLIRKLMDAITYERRDARNILTMRKRIGK